MTVAVVFLKNLQKKSPKKVFKKIRKKRQNKQLFQHIKCEKSGGDNDMSLDKAIASGKEHRKPYQGGKAYCQSCRNHGGCTWCLSNRTHKYNKKIEAMKLEEKEFEQKIQD